MATQYSREKKIFKTIESADHKFRIFIYQNELGTFSFAKSWFDQELGKFGSLGPSCGIYESIAIAENEARIRNSL